MFVVLFLLCLLHSSLGQTLRHSPSSRHRRLQSSRHRRLQAGSVHSGSQAHVLVDIQDIQVQLEAAVYIEDIGNNKTGRIKIANFIYEIGDEQLLEVNKKLQDRAGTDVNTIPFSVGGNDNALAFEVTGCSGTINSTFIDVQCDFDFKDSDDFANTTRNHVKCTHDCATFKDYNIVVVTTSIDEQPTEAATTLPFVGTCTAGTFHESDHLCVQNSCHRCSSGYYCSGADFAHTPDIGNAGTLLNEQCDACEPGTFANEPGSGACKNCDAGTYENRTASTECKNCTVGTYFSGVQFSGLSIACKNCDAGTYADVTGMSLCKNCAAGTYEPGTASTACTDCAAGTYEPGTASTACKVCFTGTYQNETRSTSCKICQDGSMTTIHTAFNDAGAQECTPCAAGKETHPERLWPCDFVDCLDEPHKCRDPTTGTCGGIGAVNCQGQCVNKHKEEVSPHECPTMYSSFKLHTSDNYGVCEEVDADARETCVSWRGPLQNGFTLDQVQSLPSQDDEFCNSTKAIYKDNMVKSAACDTQFSVIVPMYIYPNTWLPESDEFKAWNLLIESVRDTPQIQFHIIINPANGADSSAPPNADWFHYLGLPSSLPNVHLYGYVPTGYGAATINVTKYIQDYKEHWDISNIFLDEVNGAVDISSDGEEPVYDSTHTTYSDYTVTGKTICNFGSPRDQTGVEYSHDWLQVCDYSVLFENSVGELANYQPTYVQQSMPPTSIVAITHSYDAGGDEPFKDQLQALYANHFGMVYFTPAVNNYNLFYDAGLWETFLEEITTFTPISTVTQPVEWVPQLMRTPVSVNTTESLWIMSGSSFDGIIPAAFSHPLQPPQSFFNSPMSTRNVVASFDPSNLPGGG